MKPEQLYENYPYLYHIAWEGSWPNIRDKGLYSTKSLLELYGKSEDEIRTMTRTRRGHWIEIGSPGLPRAVIRDQKPISDNGLRRALPGNEKPSDWYALINSMVFFWPTKQRLKTIISARAYKMVKHDVLIVDTRKLVELEEPNIRLSHMNSGCTTPFAHKRDMSLFKTIEDYPFDRNKKESGMKSDVAEVCVLDRVDRIREVVVETKHGLAEDILMELGIE
ncbi:MAG: hypothetical protein OXH65_12885 [Paracoccaceae bacterium]|nr:hypothetical protein [Paracoccaceae bacterium]